MTIASHTVCRDGMPFIGKILKQVEPYMDKLFITISGKSKDGTIEEVEKFISECNKPVELMWENVAKPAELTQIEQFQVDRTTQDWILFLSDDDYWPHDQLELCLKEIEKAPQTPAFSVSPYQLLDFETYDSSWAEKSFSKFLRREGLNYRKDWPDEMPYHGNEISYWRSNSKVIRLPYKFYHLSYLKDYSFRSEDWAKRYAFNKGSALKLPKPLEI